MTSIYIKTFLCLYFIQQVLLSPIELSDKENSSFRRQKDNSSSEEYTAEENVGNSNVTEGDIYLDNSTKSLLHELQVAGRDAITNPVKHWPNGRVPYVFGRVSSMVRSAIGQAIAEYKKYTCIKLVPRRNERNYIYIVSEGGCWSPIGRSGGMQKLSLGRGCEHKGTAIHEIMHALGFFHEQSRRDRDRYITIYFRNIRRGMEYNFKKYRHGEADTLNEPYDLRSVMHYPRMAFSANGRPTIVAKGNPNTPLGQRSGFSRTDIRQINKLYKCSGGGGGGGGVVTPRPPRPRPPTRPPVVYCRDLNRYCRYWARLRYCRSWRHRNYMYRNCKRSCGYCRRG